MTNEWSRPATAREAVLQRIRAALDDVAPETSRPTLPPLPPLPRAYRKSDAALRGEALIAQFIERVGEYKASVHETTVAELPEAIAAALARRGVQRLAAPADLPADWPPSGVTLLRDEPPLANEALDSSDGVLTACALGIAQTGTIVLDGGPRQGRRALSLIPDYHLCVVRVDQIVGIVPEAIAALAPRSRQPLTFISGPSATSDIELNRVEGVHGPRTLEVLIVRDRGTFSEADATGEAQDSQQ